jgi:hypothetical protein
MSAFGGKPDTIQESGYQKSGHRLPLHRPDRLLSSYETAERLTPPIFAAALFTRAH